MNARARYGVALASGLLFGTGLLVSGMTKPEKVLGFLDVLGAFDASLIFVMLGAIGVHFFAYRWAKRRDAPLFDRNFWVPTRGNIDAKLITGAMIFGAGWGLSGYCPGPAIVSLAGGGLSALIFVVAMIVGMFLMAKLEGAARQPASAPGRSDTLHDSPGTH